MCLSYANQLARTSVQVALEDRGWIKGRWVEKAGQGRRCYYRITEAGRRVLADQREDWSRFIAAAVARETLGFARADEIVVTRTR